jgi:hypothetical protein
MRCGLFGRKVTSLLHRFRSRNSVSKLIAGTLFSQRIRSRAVRKVGFRTAILQLVLGALLLTVTCIGAIGYFNSARTLDDVRDKYSALVSLAMSQEVGRLLGTADKVLPELRALTLRGLIDLGDLPKLGVALAELLRREEDLSWLSYSEARSGRFIGVRRRDITPPDVASRGTIPAWRPNVVSRSRPPF